MIVRNSRFKQVLPDNFTYKGTKYTKAYAKGKQLFGYSEDDYKYQYFTVESLEDGNTITLTKGSSLPATLLTSVSYSTDNGSTWTTMTNDGTTTQTITVNLDNGDKVLFRGEGSALANNYEINGAQYRTTFSSTKTYNVYGNIMSLLYGDEFEDNTTLTQNYAFCGLFYQSNGLVSAENLIIPVTVINVLRAFTGTFNGCTSLTTPPQFAPTTISAQHGCQRMFNGCTALTKTVDLSKLTNLTGASACIEMFRGCTSLVKTSKLPATTLGDYCYYRMFYGCTSLTTAPELPAATLTSNCYNAMFYGCTSLNYIKCLATDISASGCTTNWVNNVAATGTFIKADTMTGWTIDSANGIPTGWTLHNYENCTVTLSVNDSSYGTVDGAGTYNTGDLVTVSASPSSGYRFVGWYDGSTLVSQNATYTFTIWSDVSYQAVFEAGQVDYSTQYFTIESLEDDNEVKFTKPAEVSTTMLQSFSYSTDGTNWTTIQNVDNQQIGELLGVLNTGDKIYIKGLGSAYATGNNVGNWWKYSTLVTNKRCNVYGNMMSLLYGDNFSEQTSFTSDYVFFGMFDRGNVVNAANLVLPAMTMTFCCYKYLFSRNATLEAAPELPATTLADQCYEGMFNRCTTLASPPALPATTTVGASYQFMFSGCTSLETAPALPAIELSDYCYRNMFEYCTSIVNAPTLAVNTLTRSCYQGMFTGCTALTTIALPATRLHQACYYHMLDGCTSLETIDLPATTIAQYAYDSMLNNCTAMKQISVYAAASGYEFSFGTGLAASGTYYVPRNATGYVLSACPTGWTISKTLS